MSSSRIVAFVASFLLAGAADAAQPGVGGPGEAEVGSSMATPTISGTERAQNLKLAAARAVGRGFYRAECSACHGDNGQGEGPGAKVVAAKLPDFTAYGAGKEPSNEAILKAVRDRHGKFTPAKWAEGFADAQILAAAEFMRDAYFAPLPNTDPDLGEKIYARTCSVCHGDSGDGSSWAKGGLNPPPYNFKDEKAKALSRRHMINTVAYGSPGTAMMGFSTQLRRHEIGAVVDYIRKKFLQGDGKTQLASAAAGDMPAFGRSSKAADLAKASSGKNAGRGDGHDHDHSDMTLPFPKGLAGRVAEGKKIYEQNCTACHGEKGDGQGPRAYFLFPKPANFSDPEEKQEMNRPHLFTSVAKGVVKTVMPAWNKVLNDQQIADVAEYVFASFVHPGGVPQPKAPVAKSDPKKKN